MTKIEIGETSGIKIFNFLKEFSIEKERVQNWFNKFCERKFAQLPDKVSPKRAYEIIGYKKTSIYSDREGWKNRDFISKEEIIDRYKRSRGQKQMPYEFDEAADNFIINYVPYFGATACSSGLGLTPKICLNRYKKLSGKISFSPAENNLKNSLSSLVSLSSFDDAKRFVEDIGPEEAYILGLLWADGSVTLKNRTGGETYSCLSLQISSDDFLEIKETLLKTGKWNIHNYNNGMYRWKHSSLARLGNKVIGLYLIENGYKAKSINSACLILSKIPENLHHYWFRGLVDGDGHIGCQVSPKFSLSSSYEQDWTYMEKLCIKLNIKNFHVAKNISKKGHKSSQFVISTRQDITNFLDFIYKDRKTDNIGFSRKYFSYLDIKENKSSIVNLNKYQFEVRRWMQRAGQNIPTKPIIPSEKDCNLRYSLIHEELEELKIAMGWNGEIFDTSKFDKVETYDALIDLLYVVFGGFVSFGLNMEPGWKEVCRSNNSKFAPGYKIREDGKLIKSPFYMPAELEPIVRQQEENGNYYNKSKAVENAV